MTQRCVNECEFRKLHQDGVATCGILQQLTHVESVDQCKVPSGACEACCKAFPPSLSDPNPIVASLLFQLCEQIIQLDGTAGCSRQRAIELRELASECLPMTVAKESDRPVTTTPDYSQPPSARNLSDWIPAKAAGAPIAQWAVGVTTAPRRLATVDECLDGIVRAGWNDFRVFMDSHVALAKRHQQCVVTLRDPKVGAWSNFYLSLAEMLMRQPAADAYMMVQDDVLFYNHAEIRSYLQQVLWPTDGACMASLFCPRNYTQPTHGWCRFEGQWVWGAQVFVFSRQAAIQFLSDLEVIQHRWNQDYEGSWGIDVLVGRWAERTGVPIHFPTPSLVQHVGHVSAIWDRAHIIGPRRADRFAGDVDAQD